MKNRRIFFIYLLCVTGFVFADDSKFDLLGFEIDVDGELRSRTAYLNQFYPDDKSLMSDMKGELSIEISNDSPFYFNSLFEVGNIELDDDLVFKDFTELEVKELYFGFDSGLIDSKVGIIDIKTPGGYVYSGEDTGMQLKIDFDSFKLKTFYTLPNLVEEDLEVLDDMDNLNKLFYLGIEKDTSYKYDIWAMFLDDNSQDDYDYFSGWIGWEGQKEFDRLDTDFGLTYNFGKVTEDETDYDISAFYLHGKAEYQTSETLSLFTRLNVTSGDNEMTDAVNQFQVIDGNLDTSLSLLFGGSPYSSISYFSDESLSIYSDNLSNGDITLSDPGLIIYEAGINFKPENISLESQFVIGGASTSTADGISDSNFIGVEFDLHNKYKINDTFSVALSLAYFIPGDALAYVYYTNEGEILDDDNTFKLDCSFTVKL